MIQVKDNGNQRHDYFSITSIIVYFNSTYVYIYIYLFIYIYIYLFTYIYIYLYICFTICFRQTQQIQCVSFIAVLSNAAVTGCIGGCRLTVR